MSNEVTVKELTELCKKLYETRAEHTKMTADAKAKGAELALLKSKITQILQDNEMKSHECEFGKVFTSVKKTLKFSSKPEFLEYLREVGQFDEYATVSTRVRKWVEEEQENQALGWKPPGIEGIEEFQTVTMRKK